MKLHSQVSSQLLDLKKKYPHGKNGLKWDEVYKYKREEDSQIALDHNSRLPRAGNDPMYSPG